MEEHILSPTLANRVYNIRAMRIAVFLGGPLVVGYLMAANFKQLDEKDKVGSTWVWSITGFVVIMILAFITPAEVPNIVFAIANFTIADHFIHKYQGAQIKAHIANGGPVYKTSRAVIVAAISLLSLFAMVMLFFFLADLMVQV